MYIFCVDTPKRRVMYSAAVRQPVRFQRGAMKNPTARPAAAIVSWMVTDTHPWE